jgi:hypothetical protein
MIVSSSIRVIYAFSVVCAAVVAYCPGVRAQTTREQVREQWAEAQRSGDVLAPGESGLTMRELYPQNYPAQRSAIKSRAAVLSELRDAQRTGDVLAAGDLGQRLNEVRPEAYPARTVVAGKTRDEVKAEWAEAVRNGDVLASGEAAVPLNQLRPQAFAARRPAHADMPMVAGSAPMRVAR